MKESARRPLPGSLSERKQTLREKELARKSPQLIQRPPVEKKGPLAGRLQGGRNEKQFAKFERLTPKHRLISRLPEQADAKKIHRIEDAKQLEDACHDAAQYTGTIKELIELRNIGDTEDGLAGAAEVAELLKRFDDVTPQASRSSLTGAATPHDSLVLSLSRLDKIISIDVDAETNEHSVTVQPGVRVDDLQARLASDGLYYPPFPTFEGSTLGGNVACDAAGAATFNYGQTRKWVKELELVLANGEVLNIKRGENFAHPDGYFELQTADGTIRRIPVPKYTMPKVRKISAGYRSAPKEGEMDLIDLFIGSEGTLGVITKMKLEVIPRPDITWALVSCGSEEQALTLTKKLRDDSVTTTKSTDPEDLDMVAIEYIDEQSVNNILRVDAPSRTDFDIMPPEGAKTLLLVQIKGAQDSGSFEKFYEVLTENELSDKVKVAKNEGEINQFKAIREAVPRGVNNRIKANKTADSTKKGGDSDIVKMAGDFVVPFEHLGDMLQMFRDVISTKHGLEYYVWGHHSDGNEHPNIICKTSEEVNKAKEALLECAQWVIDHGGSPLAEHGVGQSPLKQEMLLRMFGQEVVNQMRAVKDGLDPEWKLCKGNIFQIDPEKARRAWDARKRAKRQ